MTTTTQHPLVSETPTRRQVVAGAAMGAALFALPFPAFAATGELRLAIRNVHNNDSVDAVFARDGRFLPDGLAELNHGLRDWRTGQATAMDPRLLALLVQLRKRLDVPGNRKIDLISGYRSPRTNAMLRSAGGSHTGVASQSQHMLGKATDIMIPGVSLERLRGAALSLGGGGVGYYPRDGFVHVDSGPVRHW
ncbi:MAG: DUF882 domain-containing protein [Pseudomonadota bacterium]